MKILKTNHQIFEEPNSQNTFSLKLFDDVDHIDQNFFLHLCILTARPAFNVRFNSSQNIMLKNLFEKLEKILPIFEAK